MMYHGLNPVQCIWWRFKQKHGGAPPLPNQIAHRRYLHSYKVGARKSAEHDVTTSFEAEKHSFVVYLRTTAEGYGLSKLETWSYALKNVNQSWSPLFRYCVAVSEGLTTVADCFESAARVQYLCAPDAYDKIWGAWIPETLKEEGVITCPLSSRRAK